VSTRTRVAPAVRDRVGDTVAAVGLAIRRRDSLAVAGAATAGYLAAFLWAARDLSYRPDVSPGVFVADDPLGLLFRRNGPVTFEPVAVVDTGVLRLLVSPLNVAVGLAIATLVGLSLGLTYLAVAQPKACGIGAGSGLLASIPALFSGTACCAPVLFIALGIQASGLLLTAFSFALPIGILLLVGSIVYLAGKVDVSGTAVA